MLFYYLWCVLENEVPEVRKNGKILPSGSIDLNSDEFELEVQDILPSVKEINSTLSDNRTLG